MFLFLAIPNFYFGSRIESVFSLFLYGSRCTQLPVHRELTQWLLGPSPSLSVATDCPTDTGPDSNDVLTRSDLFS